MFARPAFRAAQPLKMQVRRYATEGAAAPKKSSNALVFSAIAVGAAAAGYYFLAGSAPVAQEADKIKAKVLGQPKKALLGGEQGFVPLVLESVDDFNHNTKKFRFKLPEEDMVSGVVVTSAILTKFQPPGEEKPVIRPYTPINDEDATGFMDLLVKKYPNGPMSTHIHDLKPGQTLEVKGPLPKYPWTANKHEHIALVAGGTGITPMYQLCRAIFANPADKTKVTLLFGNIAEEDILLKQELVELENKYPQRFRAFYTLDKAPKSWAGTTGFITQELLKTVLPEPKEENIKVFVCGPPGLMKHISGPKVSPKDQGELTGLLKALGYSKDQVYKF